MSKLGWELTVDKNNRCWFFPVSEGIAMTYKMAVYFSPLRNPKELYYYNYLFQLIAFQNWCFLLFLSFFPKKEQKWKSAMLFASVITVQ